MFEVGDVVMTNNKEKTRKMAPAVITRVGQGYVDVLFADGSNGWRREERVKKTDRRINDMQSVLDLIRYGGENDAGGT